MPAMPEDQPRRAARDLEPLFAPTSVAVIGASRTEGSVGHAVVRNLIYGGYEGVIYPVNLKARSILGIRCVPGIDRIDHSVDLAVVIVPAAVVPDVVAQCADCGTRHVVVISAGFKEVGGAGVQREARLQALAAERGLSIVGPNCLGVINTAEAVSMNASFAREMPRAGCLGLISQSGALCTALLDYAKGQGIGFSRFISFGNKVDVNEVDLLRSMGQDPRTRVILMYVEDISSGPEFAAAAYEITHGSNPTPIVAIKTGRTAQGAAAAASHTGSLAGSDEVYDAVMEQAGVMRVDSVSEMFDLAEGFADPALPAGDGIAIVTNAGGPGIMATDAAIRSDLKLARFQDYTVKSLQFQMPAAGSIKNPVDVVGDARHDRYRSALDAVTADVGVDQVLIIVTPQTMTDVTEIARVIGETKEFCTKPLFACLMGLVDVSAGVELLQNEYDVPTYAFPESAVRAMAAKSRFARWVKLPEQAPRQFDADRDAVDAIFADERSAGRTQLVEAPALRLLTHYGFPIVPSVLARSAADAAAAAEQMGYPVALKISGPQILHKTDVGGVTLNLADGAAVGAAYETMVAAVRAKMGRDVEVWGVLVQKMLDPGKEIILGMTRDPRFGPLLMFGLGGIYAEALKDVSFRMAPIRENVAREMVADIRSIALLRGVRGEKPSDLDAVAECLLRLSQLVIDYPCISELDINPLLVYPRGQGAIVADARIILATSEAVS